MGMLLDGQKDLERIEVPYLVAFLATAVDLDRIMGYKLACFHQVVEN